MQTIGEDKKSRSLGGFQGSRLMAMFKKAPEEKGKKKKNQPSEIKYCIVSGLEDCPDSKMSPAARGVSPQWHRRGSLWEKWGWKCLSLAFSEVGVAIPKIISQFFSGCRVDSCIYFSSWLPQIAFKFPTWSILFQFILYLICFNFISYPVPQCVEMIKEFYINLFRQYLNST